MPRRHLEWNKAAVCDIQPQERRRNKVVSSLSQLEQFSWMIFFTFFSMLWVKEGKNKETPKALRSEHRSWLCTLPSRLMEWLMPQSPISGNVDTRNHNLWRSLGLCGGRRGRNAGSAVWVALLTSANPAKAQKFLWAFVGICRIPWPGATGSCCTLEECSGVLQIPWWAGLGARMD